MGGGGTAEVLALQAGSTNTRVRRWWRDGEVLAFDDSFEHEVWQEGESDRWVLMLDIWHPMLTHEQRRSLGGGTA